MDESGGMTKGAGLQHDLKMLQHPAASPPPPLPIFLHIGCILPPVSLSLSAVALLCVPLSPLLEHQREEEPPGNRHLHILTQPHTLTSHSITSARSL